jgi:cysteine desulfurase
MTREDYLDYHATTPVDPKVLEAMWPYYTEHFGNPASRSHAVGREASAAVERARDQVARSIGARPEEITFTSGATESNNLALTGIVRAYRDRRPPRIVTVATEHRSVLETCRALERDGCEVVRLGVRPDGLVDLDTLRSAVAAPTLLVSIMMANNEIGVVQPIGELASIAHEAGAIVHTDASQAVGKLPVDVRVLGVDLMSFTAHKMYGPKGVGVLFFGADLGRLEPLLHGGGHERGLRSGTLNVPAIVGFGAAATIAAEELDGEGSRLGRLRDELLAGLRTGIPDLSVNGSLVARLPHNLHVSVPGVDAEALGPVLDDLFVSTGSACSSGRVEPSHVLLALGMDEDLARASIRFGLGRWTTPATIARAVGRVTEAVLGLRRLEAMLRSV